MLWIKTTPAGLTGVEPYVEGYLAAPRRWWQGRPSVRLSIWLNRGGMLNAVVRRPGELSALRAALHRAGENDYGV